MSATPSPLSQLIDAYHLWSLVIPLCVLGAYHAMGIIIQEGFHLCREVHEAYYTFKTRCRENKRRYEQSLHHAD
jgi:hypothetical protein